MKKPAPQTTTIAIQTAIAALIKVSDRFRDWNSDQIIALRDEIEKLHKVDAPTAFNQIGSLAAICGRPDDLAEFYRKARLHPDKLGTNENFWYAFSNAGRYMEAHSVGSQLLHPRHGYFPQIWRRAASRGHLQEVVKLWPVAKKTYRDLDDDDLAPLQREAAFMTTVGLTDQDVLRVLELMGEVQREHRIMFGGHYPLCFQLHDADSEGPAYLFGKMEIDAEVTEVQAMNRRLAKLVVERLGAFPDGLVLAFRKKLQAEQLPIAA